MTRAGRNGTSTARVWVCFQSRMFSTSERFTRNSSQFLTADSRRTRTENGRRSEEEVHSEICNKRTIQWIQAFYLDWLHGWSAVCFTISRISKFREIEKLVFGVIGIQRLNNMIKRIFHSLSHPPQCVDTNLEKGNDTMNKLICKWWTWHVNKISNELK